VDLLYLVVLVVLLIRWDLTVRWVLVALMVLVDRWVLVVLTGLFRLHHWDLPVLMDQLDLTLQLRWDLVGLVVLYLVARDFLVGLQ